MRLVAGSHRGRTLAVPAGETTRPTSDRARQALFNILDHGQFGADGGVYRGRPVLDAFAGTGALGLEALSRGASAVSFIESDARALAVLRANIRSLSEERRSQILAVDATRPPVAPAAPWAPVSLVLLDPPYGRDLGPPTLTGLAAAGWLGPLALVVLEVAAREDPATPPGFQILDDRTYGAARFRFLRWTAQV